jgi:hypothetical protein
MAVLRRHSEALDMLLDGFVLYDLDDMPVGPTESRELFEAASVAFQGARSAEIAAPPDLESATFTDPLLIVIAAYLAVHGPTVLPSTKHALFDELLAHEDRYWRASMMGVPSDVELRRRIVALATIYLARSEEDAALALRLIPDLADATEVQRRIFARWAAGLYPGEAWWNALEPDLLGEHLVAACFTHESTVLNGLFAELIADAGRPLRVLTRASENYPELRTSARAALSEHLGALVDEAESQAVSGPGAAHLVAGQSLATALADAIVQIGTEGKAAFDACQRLPPRHDLVLDQLAVALTRRAVEHTRDQFDPADVDAVDALAGV